MNDSNKSRDDFWDIDKLVPKKKSTLHPFRSSSQVTVHNIEGEGSSETSAEQRRLTVLADASAPAVEENAYEPEYHSLIKRVSIKRSIDKFDFYGNFRKAALVYFDYKTPRSDFVPYYSYMPQYTQLTSEQKGYYFYWRDEVRRGKFIKCDYSYLYLYVYEILNLPDKMPPAEGLDMLCRLWREYRSALPRIDSYFSVWIQDYCLVHRLPCPMDKLRDFIFEVLCGVDFKEFYLSEITAAGDSGTEAMLGYLSDYDWRKTKYAADENSEIFKNHMIGAMSRVVRVFCSVASGLDDSYTAVIRRDAFPHSLCTHAVKCKLEIEYVPLYKDDSLRRLISSAVRYTENKLRALLGVKSRLGVKELNEGAKRLIDEYFDGIFEIERRRRQKENAPEYEKLYDAQREKLSFSDADEIEKASWITTARLVSESDDTRDESASDRDRAGFAILDNTECGGSDVPYSEETLCDLGHGKIDDSEVISAKRGDSGAFLASNSSEDGQSEAYGGRSAVDVGSTPASGFENPLGLIPEDVATLSALISGEATVVSDEAYERINEAFQSSDIGDVVLEYSDDGYVLIDDYLEDVGKILFGNK